jgi:TPR repeat protein
MKFSLNPQSLLACVLTLMAIPGTGTGAPQAQGTKPKDAQLFPEAQTAYEICFDKYKNHFYEQAVLHCSRAEQIHPNYKSAREILSYAKMGIQETKGMENYKKHAQDAQILMQKCDQGKDGNACEKLAGAFSSGIFYSGVEYDLKRAYSYAKRACEYGSSRLCEKIKKACASAVKDACPEKPAR